MTTVMKDKITSSVQQHKAHSNCTRIQVELSQTWGRALVDSWCAVSFCYCDCLFFIVYVY